MEKARAIYKCKRCGKEFEVDGRITNGMYIGYEAIPVGPITKAHKCEDGINGFGDLIGSYIKEGE